jgi:hypothetical protein
LLLDFLEDPDPGVVAAVIEVLLRETGHPKARQRLDDLVARLAELTPAWRRELAKVIGALNETRYDQALVALLHDPEASVRRLAIQAAGRERHESHIPELIDALEDRQTRNDARVALVAYHDVAVEELSHRLDDRSISKAQRMHLPRVLAAIGTPSAARTLLFSNSRDDAELQQRIGHRLFRLARDSGELELDRTRTDESIGRRLLAFSAYEQALRDLGPDIADGLGTLRRAINNRCDQNLRLAFQLLGLHRGPERMQQISTRLMSGSARSGAAYQDAVELLDAALTGDRLREDILSLVDARHRVDPKMPVEARAAELCSSRDPLLRGIARKTWRMLGHSELPPAAEIKVGPGAEEIEGEDMADDVLDRIFVLEHVDLFEGLPADDLAAIATIATERELAPGETLYEEGDKGDSMYVVVSGEVALTRQGALVMKLSAGSTVGQVSLLDQGPRPVTVTVSGNGPATFLRIGRSAFMDLVADRAFLMQGLFSVLAHRLRVLIEREGRGDGPHEKTN